MYGLGSIKGNIELTKVDEDYPENKLSGAVFEVYSDVGGDGKLDKDDVLLGTMTELEGGVYQMKELRYGKYLVREKTAPTGFVLDENVYPVSIEENGKTYNKAGVGFINTAQKCSLKIVKTSSDGKVESFSFRVTGVNYDQTFTTDRNGEILIENLRIGEYTVSELNDKASAGYILPADKQATVQVGATTIVQILGAVLHNIGQIAVAVVMMKTTAVISYLPFLLVSRCIAGAFTGVCAQILIGRVKLNYVFK